MKDFLFTLLAWLSTLPFIIGSVLFALYNQGEVTVIFNPFLDTHVMPLYVPVLCAIAFGFLFGAVMTWAAMSRLRALRREQARRIKLLEKQLEAANHNQNVRHDYGTVPPALLARP